MSENNINYIIEKRFSDCKNKRVLPFDFYLPDFNLCIEYDGLQHFESNDRFGGNEEFNKIKIRDNIKNNYCSGINGKPKLLRISYKEYDNINYIIKNYFLNNFSKYLIG